jgi:hypothetical protein
MDREAIDARLDELRAANPGREDFLAAVRAFADSLDDEQRKLLGDVLLRREPTTGGFDVLNRRLEEGGWMKRTLGRMAERERKIREG